MSKSKRLIMIISVLAVSFISDMGMYVNPIIDTVANAFPGTPYSTILQISALPYTTCMIVSFVFGFITGRKIGYKPVIIVGCLCMIAGGVAPAFINGSFTAILIARAVFGIGIGLVVCLNAYVLTVFDASTASLVLGLHIAVINIGSVLMQLAAGFLGAINWHLTFYISLVAAIPLIMTLAFLEEPKREENTSSEKAKIHLKGWNIVYCLGAILITMFTYPILAVMSNYIADLRLGDAAVSGVVLSFYTAGAALGGLAYSTIKKKAGRYTLSIFVGLAALGLVTVIFLRSTVMITVGTFLCGFGFYPTLSLFCDFCGAINDEATMNLAASLIWAGSYFGCGPIAPYWITLCEKLTGSMTTGSFAIGAVLLAVIALIFIFVNPESKSKEA